MKIDLEEECDPPSYTAGQRKLRMKQVSPPAHRPPALAVRTPGPGACLDLTLHTCMVKQCSACMHECGERWGARVPLLRLPLGVSSRVLREVLPLSRARSLSLSGQLHTCSLVGTPGHSPVSHLLASGAAALHPGQHPCSVSQRGWHQGPRSLWLTCGSFLLLIVLVLFVFSLNRSCRENWRKLKVSGRPGTQTAGVLRKGFVLTAAPMGHCRGDIRLPGCDRD